MLALVVIATIAVYLPSLRNGWVSDDLPILVQNKSIRTSSFIANAFTHDVLWSIKQHDPGRRRRRIARTIVRSRSCGSRSMRNCSASIIRRRGI